MGEVRLPTEGNEPTKEQRVRQAVQLFTDTIENMDVRSVTSDVAVVTVTSRMSTYVTPDGAMHENERHIRTFVVVKRNGQWLITQDQNTLMGG